MEQVADAVDEARWRSLGRSAPDLHAGWRFAGGGGHAPKARGGRAQVSGGRVAEWRVYADNQPIRRRMRDDAAQQADGADGAPLPCTA